MPFFDTTYAQVTFTALKKKKKLIKEKKKEKKKKCYKARL